MSRRRQMGRRCCVGSYANFPAKSGRIVSFAEAARMLRDGLDEHQRWHQTDQAKRDDRCAPRRIVEDLGKARHRAGRSRLPKRQELLRDGLDEHQRCGIQTDQAKRDLIDAAPRRIVEDLGKARHTARRQANPAAQYEAVEFSLFLDELVSATEWGTIGPDPEHPVAFLNYLGPTFREARLYTADVLRLWPAQRTIDSPLGLQVTVPVTDDSNAHSSDYPVHVVIDEEGGGPPPSTLPWAVIGIMERLTYPPDRAWNLLHRAICASELTPRRGKLWAPGQGPMLEQWERDNLHFDFRRYRHDARSGGPFGSSLRICRPRLPPARDHTIPAEEVDHWLASQASAQDAGRSREPEPSPPLPDDPVSAPDGFVYIDVALDVVQERLG